MVLDNQNLEEIWDSKTHPNLMITSGNVSFHDNSKLCLNKIYDFVESVGRSDNLNGPQDISQNTNGYRVACE